MKACKTMCSQCPFRRKALAGWLGGNTPEAFVDAAIADASVACHMSMNQDLPRKQWEQEEAVTQRCLGALTLMRNWMKSPRDPDMRNLLNTIEPNHKDVFSTPHEFVDHHNKAKVKSWDL